MLPFFQPVWNSFGVQQFSKQLRMFHAVEVPVKLKATGHLSDMLIVYEVHFSNRWTVNEIHLAIGHLPSAGYLLIRKHHPLCIYNRTIYNEAVGKDAYGVIAMMIENFIGPFF